MTDCPTRRDVLFFCLAKTRSLWLLEVSPGARLSLPNSRVRPVDLRSMRWTCRGWRLSTSPVRCCFIGMNMNQTMKIHLGPLQRNAHLIVPWGLWDMGGGIHGIRDWKPGSGSLGLRQYTQLESGRRCFLGMETPELGMQLKNLKLLMEEIWLTTWDVPNPL